MASYRTADRFQSRFYAQRHYRVVARQNYDARIEGFLLDCCRRFRAGPISNALELACGPGLLSLGLAARGVTMTCVDCSESMIRAVRREARVRRVTLKAVCADMIGYRASEPVDLAFCIGPSTSHVQSNDEMLTMLESVRDSLRSRALYIADFDFVPGILHRTPSAVEPPWLVFDDTIAHAAEAREGNTSIEIRFGAGPSRYDPIRQHFRSHNEIVVRRGATVRTTRTPSIGKLYFPLELEGLVARTPGLALVALFGTYDINARLNVDSDRFIAVIRRA